MQSHTSHPLVAAARTVGVCDVRVLDALEAIPRQLFLPPEYADLAQTDAPVRLPHGLMTTQPSLVAVMIEALELAGEENVLEIGTGYGYQTALLAKLARRVWSIEWWRDFGTTARANLARAGVRNAIVEIGDGSRGLVEHAPYHAIVVAAAAPVVPQPLVEQLLDGGRLVVPIGKGGDEHVRLFVKTASALTPVHDLIEARFVPLVGQFGISPR